MIPASISRANIPSAGTARVWSLRATPATLCRVTLWSFLIVLITSTSADPDLWGHLRFGLDMLASKSLVAVDPYSFTSDRAWINHEWLAELLMGVGYAGLGPLGLNLLKLAVIVVVGTIGFVVAKQERATPIARDLYVCLLLFATYSRTQVVRPQMFSVAIFATLLFCLREAERRPRLLACIPVLFVAWVNLHGAWIVGLGALGVWMLADALAARRRQRLTVLAVVGGAAILATLVNPYGLDLWRFLGATVGLARPDITDWKPLLQLPPAILALEAILPLTAAAALLSRGAWRHVAICDAVVIALLGAATFRVGRVDAFFEAAIAILLAEPILTWLKSLEARVGGLFRRESSPVAAIAVMVAAYVLVTGSSRLRVIEVTGSWIPDRTAAAFLRQHGSGARVLTWFNWGEYALWQLAPSGIRVSMDGRRETVYSARVIRDHERFYQASGDLLDYPDRIDASLVWLPTHLPVIASLQQRGWTPIFETGQSVVLRRATDTVPPSPSPSPSPSVVAPAPGPDIFPWP
jgi:hypothetical protein